MTEKQKNVIEFIESTFNIGYDVNIDAYSFIGLYWYEAQKKHTIEKVKSLLETASGSIKIDLYQDILYMIENDVIFFKYDKELNKYIEEQLSRDLTRFINTLKPIDKVVTI
jgi:argininosuccinate synthase